MLRSKKFNTANVCLEQFNASRQSYFSFEKFSEKVNSFYFQSKKNKKFVKLEDFNSVMGIRAEQNMERSLLGGKNKDSFISSCGTGSNTDLKAEKAPSMSLMQPQTLPYENQLDHQQNKISAHIVQTSDKKPNKSILGSKRRKVSVSESINTDFLVDKKVCFDTTVQYHQL